MGFSLLNGPNSGRASRRPAMNLDLLAAEASLFLVD
jgi:hypothetical protein